MLVQARNDTATPRQRAHRPKRRSRLGHLSIGHAAEHARALPRRRVDEQLPAGGGNPVAHVRQARPVGARDEIEPHAVVRHLEVDPAGSATERNGDTRVRTRVLDGVLNRLERAVVDRGLDAGSGPPDAVVDDPYRNRSAAGKCRYRGAEASLAQDRRVDPMREGAELLDGGRRVRGKLVELVPDLAFGRLLAGKLELDLDCHQPLLGAVVQVALEAEALTFRGLDDPGARGVQLVDESRVLQQQKRGRPEAVDDLGLVGEHGIVNHRQHRLPALLDLGHVVLGRRLGQLERRAAGVYVTAALRLPDSEGERRVSERAADDLLHRLRREPAAARVRQRPPEVRGGEDPAPELADEQRERNREGRDPAGDPQRGDVPGGSRLGEDAGRGIRRDQADRRTQERHDRAAAEMRRQAGLLHEQDDHRGERKGGQSVRGEVHRPGGRVRRVDDLKRVLRAIARTVGERAPVREHAHDQEHHRPDDRARRSEAEDEAPLEIRAEPVAREAQEEVGEVHDQDCERKAAERECQRVRRGGERGERVEKAARRHQRTESAQGTAPPRVRADPDEAGHEQAFDHGGGLRRVDGRASPRFRDRGKGRDHAEHAHDGQGKGLRGSRALDSDGGGDRRHDPRIRECVRFNTYFAGWCAHPGQDSWKLHCPRRRRAGYSYRDDGRRPAGFRHDSEALVMSSATPTARTARLELVPQEQQLDFLESKVQAPGPRPGTVSRTALVNRLRATTASVTTMVAPAGYGKTTLLSQWAARDSRAFAWVTLDDRDNDPVVLLRHIAAALTRDEPVGQRVIDALGAPAPSIWSAAVPRLAAELSARRPIVLVLDDFNLLRSRAALEPVAALIDDESEGSMLVAATRVTPKLPLAPLRASGKLLELGAEELALSKREARLLLRATGVSLGEARTDELIEQCEGWAAALYLAALSIRDAEQTGRGRERFGGDDRYLADYFRSEYLCRLRPGPLHFLRRTSVLDQMCGPLCDAVLEDEGSARELEKIERASLFLVPLDNRREWYRYHHLFRELLQRELAEQEPDLVPVLHGHAADWFEADGDRESALEHAYAAGDTDRAAEILAAIALPVYYSGRVATLERWFNRFERAGLLERYPAVAVHGCRIHALRGRTEDAERWLDAAMRGKFSGKLPDGSRSIQPWISVLNAWLCRKGAKRMLADAGAALAGLAEGSNWRPSALLAQGAALLLLDEDEQADEVLASAAACAAEHGSAETQVVALAERALLARKRGDHDKAEELAKEANELVTSSGVEGAPARALEHAATAQTLLYRGRWNEARACLTAAQELLPYLTIAIPWLAVQTRIELGRGFITLRDGPAVEELLIEIDDVVTRIPGLGMLAASAEELQREADAVSDQEGSVAGLTPAELRLLPLLATHFSFREIAEQLYVSRNTIKTQAISVYRKLGVSSRSEAITEAHRLGLGEHLRVLISKDR